MQRWTGISVVLWVVVGGLGIAVAQEAENGTEEVVEWVDSEENADYKPKTETEGASWYFDPKKVSLNEGSSSSGTNFKGARILSGNGEVEVLGDSVAGSFGDVDSERYWFWEGKTLYFGVQNEDSENSVDAIIEFYWFESSIPRGSDFYVMLCKVKSSPNPWDNWHIIKESNMSVLNSVFLFWQDVQPAQHLSVFMEPGGAHGSLRWDFSVPFETYLWEPYKVMQIQESYGAGFESEGEGEVNVGMGMLSMFSEGGAIIDLTNELLVQAKGTVNESFKIESQYTVTHYRWMMLVQSGAEAMHYKLAVLPAEDDQEPIVEDSAYSEYFIVLQAERGKPVHIQDLEIGGQFKKAMPFWFDKFQGLSASLSDIWITPPTGVCLPGEIAPAGTCEQEGVCGLAQPVCSGTTNQWVCPVVASFEEEEISCDGLDNDCDGVIDESLTQSCTTACGTGTSSCINGEFQACSAPQAEAEICDGLDNDCDGQVDEGVTQVCEADCGSGIRHCTAGSWSSCDAPVATSEICDGLDNDCDGQVDEGVAQACNTACGSGMQTCVNGVFQSCNAPAPEQEICDGFDNDCDGEVDEGVVQSCESACGVGLQTCVNGSFQLCNAPAPQPEICDGMDNDCDGIVDNGCSASSVGDTTGGNPTSGNPTGGNPNGTGWNSSNQPGSNGGGNENPFGLKLGDGAGDNGEAAGGCSSSSRTGTPFAPMALLLVALAALRWRTRAKAHV